MNYFFLKTLKQTMQSNGDSRGAMMETKGLKGHKVARPKFPLKNKPFSVFSALNEQASLLNAPSPWMIYLAATIRYPDAVRTKRPEKGDIFAQRYQSHPITTKFQKRC